MPQVDWKGVTDNGGRAVGAIGFIGDDACIVISYFDDRDGNMDGKVSVGEWLAARLSPISIEGSAAVRVAMLARGDMDIMMRDPSFDQAAKQMFSQFAAGLVMDGIYAVYFSRGVSIIGGGIAKTITKNAVKEFVIKKGFESAVKEAFKEAVGR